MIPNNSDEFGRYAYDSQPERAGWD